MFFTVSTAIPCEFDYSIWIPRSPSADPLYRFVKRKAGSKQGLAGYIDRSAKIVIPLSLPYFGGNDDGEFHDGLLQVGVDEGEYVDVRGETAIRKHFERGWDFSEGLAVAMADVGGNWGYINTQGQFAIKPHFANSSRDYVWPFEDGLAMVKVAGRYGYIDHAGSFVIPPTFLLGDGFRDEMARVVVEGPCLYSRIPEESPCPDFGVVPPDTVPRASLPSCKYTFIDKSGRVISQQRYDYARPFSEGLAPVRVEKKWGYINKRGQVVIAPQFDSAAPFSEGISLVSENELFGYIDRAGNYLIKPQFRYAEAFAEGLAVVGDPGSYVLYIDRTGTQAIPDKFLLASPFFKGLAHVKLDGDRGPSEIEGAGTYAYIEKTGRIVFRYRP